MAKKRIKSKTFLMTGALGNQLFIVTAGIYYSIKNKEKVIFDFSTYVHASVQLPSDIRLFNTDLNFQCRPCRRMVQAGLYKILHRSSIPIYTSAGAGYDASLNDPIFEKKVFGYFQTHKYLDHPEVRNLINSLYFSSVSEWFGKCSLDMLDLPTISVHIRRGDYMNLKDTFGVLSSDYYNSAIKFIVGNSSTKYARVLVFSDDIPDAKQLFSKLKISLPVQFFESPENSAEETLILMSQSDALVISNSSFSWWAAQLGKKSKFVVCPSKWYRGAQDPEDLVPPEWHVQESHWEL